MTIQLMAVLTAGEVYITRDEAGVWRRHERYLPDSMTEVSADEAQRAIMQHDFMLIDEKFTDMKGVEERVSELTPQVNSSLPISNLLVTVLLPDLQKRVRVEGSASEDVVRLIGKFLANESVAKDPQLSSALTALLN